jgi:hypothetical protein
MKTINILILLVSLFFFCQLQSYGQKGVKTLPLKYKGIKLNHDFKNVLPRIVREYNNHYFVATERAIYEFSKEGQLLSTFKIPNEIKYVAGFYKSSKEDLIFVATYTRLYVLTKQGAVKKVFHTGEYFDFLPIYGFFSYMVKPNYPKKDVYFIRQIDESLKQNDFKLSHRFDDPINISGKFLHGFNMGDNSDEVVSYSLPHFDQRKVFNLSKQFPNLYFLAFLGQIKAKAFFLSTDGKYWKGDTLKVIDFKTKEVLNYKLKFKQPKLKLQKIDTEEILYTHPMGHFIYLMDDKLLVLTNTVEGSFIYEVEY